MNVTEKDEIVTIEHRFDENLLLRLGQQIVANHPESRYYFYRENAKSLIEFLEDTDMRIGRAIGRWFHIEFGIDITDEEKTLIGSEMANSSTEPEDIKVRVTFGAAGNPEDYYHEDSCWWGGYESSRDYVESNGGGAIRLYDLDNEIVGRVWFLPYRADGLNGIVMFNAYGHGSFEHIVSWGPLVSKVFGAQWSKIRYHIETKNAFFQNSGNCVFVGEGNVSDRTYYHSLDEPDEWIYAEITCDYCGRAEYDDDMSYSDNYGHICSYCRDHNFIWIEAWDDYELRENCVEVYRPGLRRWHNWVWYSIDSDDIVQIGDTYYHIDDCTIDYYGNTYAPDDTESWFECAESGEIYPINEAILCPNGNRIHESVYFGEKVTA